MTHRRAAALIILLSTAIAGCNWDANTPGLSPNAEQAALSAYPAEPTPEESVAVVDEGERIFRAAACASCHSTDHERKGLIGPPLGGLATRVLERHDHNALEARRWLVKHIRDPFQYPGPYKQEEGYQGAIMPPHSQIKDKDMRALVEYLWVLP